MSPLNRLVGFAANALEARLFERTSAFYSYVVDAPLRLVSST